MTYRVLAKNDLDPNPDTYFYDLDPHQSKIDLQQWLAIVFKTERWMIKLPRFWGSESQL